MDVASPCIRQCTLNDNDVCVGCGRHLEEILVWTQATDTQKLAIVDAARRRLDIIKSPRAAEYKS